MSKAHGESQCPNEVPQTDPPPKHTPCRLPPRLLRLKHEQESGDYEPCTPYDLGSPVDSVEQWLIAFRDYIWKACEACNPENRGSGAKRCNVET